MRVRPVVPVCGLRTGQAIAWGFLAFSVLGAPARVAAQQPQPWTISPSISLSETFTDNENLDPDGEKDPALITTVSPGLSLTLDFPSVTANVSGNVNFRYQTLNDEEFDFDGTLSGFANVEWFEDLLFTDFRASVNQELLESDQGRSASSSNTQNLDTVQNYQVSPYLTNRFGDYADSELRYQFTYTDSKNDALSRTYGHEGSWNLNSGTEFTALQWSTVGRYSWQHRPNDNDVQSYSGELDLRYVLDPTFSLLGNTGYQWFDGNQGDEFNEPIWEAGFLVTPSPRAELSYLYGKRNDAKSHTASLRYDITAMTRLNGSYAESFQTGQQRFSNNLSSIGSDPNGNQVNTNTNQSFSSNPSSTSSDNQTTRTKTASLGLDSTFGRNTVAVSGNFEDRNVRNSPDDEEAYIGTLSFSRQITQSLSADLSGSYQKRIFDVDADTNTYVGTVSLGYSLSQSISTSAIYTYQTRTSSDPNEEFTENTVTVSIGIAF